VSVTSGSSSSVNAGVYAPASISGTVFSDSNVDGLREGGENSVAGVTVKLLDGTGHATGVTATTDANGTYRFTGLAPGSYQVQFVAPAGQLFAPQGVGTTATTNSAANAQTGITNTVVLTSGQASTVNAGVYGSGGISGLVFFDGMATGTYHVGDPGVAGIKVNLLTAQGAATGISTTTNNYGQYTFAGVSAGTYLVQVVAPAGMSYSTIEHASGNPLLDSDVNPKTGVTDAVTVVANQMNASANAGLIFNGHFAGTTPTTLGIGQTYDGNQGSGVIVGAGNDLVHVGSGGNNIVVLGGTNNLVEAGAGATNDIVASSGALNAQTQNAANGFLFAGTGNSTLQGEQGNAYLVGGRGNNMVSGGSANNVLVGGISSGTVSASGTTVLSYTTGGEVRLTGTSAKVLFQKGDGVQVLDNTFDPTKDSLQIYGYKTGTMQTVNGIKMLYLGNNDLIVFNGGTPFQNGTGSTFAGVSFNTNIMAAPEEVVTFGSNGLPQIVASGSTTIAAPAPTTTTPIPTTSAVAAGPATPGGTATPPAMGATSPVTTAAPTMAASSSASQPLPASGATHTVTMAAWNQSVTLDNTDHVVSGSQGNATIHAGSGNNAITASGYNNVISLGDGNNTVTGPQGNTSVIVGNGQNTITLQGHGNSVTTGSGTNTIVAGAGNATVDTGAGHDTVTLIGYSNLLIGGLGHSSFIGGSGNTYQANGVSSSGGMDITGFTLNNGDVLDVSKLLAQSGWQQSASNLSNFLKVAEVGQDTVVSFDVTGHGNSYSTLATLHNTGAASLGDLQAHHSISLF
jgi:hypothetical protein